VQCPCSDGRRALTEGKSLTTSQHTLIAFLIASGLLTITPGLDTALVLRTVAMGGERRAIAASLGICLGLLTWGFSTSVGLGVLLNASRLAYNVLRVVGACHLVFLGCKMFSRSGLTFVQKVDLDPTLAGNSARGDDQGRWFVRGLLTNLLNPKVGVFYVTFLPLFIQAGTSVVGFSMRLASIHVIEGILWFAVLIAAVRPLSVWLRKMRVAKTFDRITGAVFVGFGLRLLFDERR
jgi:threonine/homoserine/homoserine lactone efflux protein